MKRILTILSLAGLIFMVSCVEEEVKVIPIGDFDYELAIKGTGRVVFPTYAAIEIIDKSVDVERYEWDFGNGETSTEKAPIFSYSKSGDYVITLTAFSSTGDKSINTKNIRIVDRTLQDVTISRLKWNCVGEMPDWDSDKVADVFVEIKKDGVLYFKTPVIKNVPESTTPLVVLVNDWVVIDANDLTSFKLTFHLFAIDEEGNEHQVYASNMSGTGFSSDYYGNTWRILTGFGGTTITFNGGYE